MLNFTIAVKYFDRVFGTVWHWSSYSKAFLEFDLYFATSWTDYVPSALNIAGIGNAWPAQGLNRAGEGSEDARPASTVC